MRLIVEMRLRRSRGEATTHRLRAAAFASQPKPFNCRPRPSTSRIHSNLNFPKCSLFHCWNSSRHTNGEDMFREIVDLGFNHVELSHGLNVAMMEGCSNSPSAARSRSRACTISARSRRGARRFSDCYEFSSSREEVRQRAVKMTLQTLDYASGSGRSGSFSTPAPTARCGLHEEPHRHDPQRRLSLEGLRRDEKCRACSSASAPPRT